MTAYEASDLINGAWSNLLAGQALFLSAVSAYLFVAFTVGARLTRFQVFFISLIFALFGLSAIMGFHAQATAVVIYNAIRVEQLGEGLDFGASGAGDVTLWMTVSLRTLFIVGSLVFMWQSRRAKVD